MAVDVYRIIAMISSGRIVVVLVMLALTLSAVATVDHIVRRAARGRRSRFEALHAAILSLLIDEHSAEPGARIETMLARIVGLLGADRAWLMTNDGVESFYGWPADGASTYESASAAVARITRRFPWDSNTIIVAPGERAAVGLGEFASRRRATEAASLLLRSQKHEDLAVFCIVGRPSVLIDPETLQGLALALLIVVQLERRHRLEADRLALERKLALGRRMETIGALASGVAHNLNNILGAIAGFGETAALHVPSDGAATDNLREISHAVGRASALVGDVLRFGRRVEGPPEPVDLNILIAETAKLLAVSLPRCVVLELEVSDETVRVAGEFGQLQQVLLNLCANAANAMPEGGAIVCRAARRLLDDPVRLSHAVLRRGHYATLAVEDGGHGIAAHAIPHLFDAFYTTRAKGTGLGLSTAREIVEQHGGAIDVDSMTGAGSRFTIWLPLTEEILSSEARASRGTGETVLILNVDAKRLSDDEELLAALGYEPRGIADPSHLATMQDAIDAVLVAGFDPQRVADLADRVRAAGIDAPMLFAVPQPEPGAGMLRYPLRPARLAHALSRCLTPGQPGETVPLAAAVGSRRV